VYEGEILYLGQELSKMSTREMRAIRGKEISMIFQDPMTSLNPTFKIGDQLVETIKLHMKLSTDEAKNKAKEYLALTKLPDPERIMNSYSFELSGGMRQRVMIALALVCNPKIIIADEPTTALDPTVQAQILDLLDELKRKFDTSIILITHDLAVVYNYADSVAVMYAGSIVEYGTRDDIFYRTAHRYTKGLLESIPRMGETRKRLFAIPGSPPEFSNLPQGCRFSPRCMAEPLSCDHNLPKMQKLSDTHYSECSK
jgi:oligopeptide transport system ATP-binding protein